MHPLLAMALLARGQSTFDKGINFSNNFTKTKCMNSHFTKLIDVVPRELTTYYIVPNNATTTNMAITVRFITP